MSQKIINALKICAVAFLTIIATACDVHEFPNPSEELPDTSENSDVTLRLLFDEAMPLHREVIYNRAAFEKFDAYYHVEVYRMKDNGKYDDEPYVTVNYVNADITELNHEMNVRLRDGRYRVIAWTHYVEGDDIFKHFEFDNLKTTSISKYTSYEGNTDMSDSFRAVTYIDVANSRDQREYEIEMTRPVAKFEIYATDISDFLKGQGIKDATDIDNGKYTAKIIYKGFVASEYNLIYDYVSDSRTNLYFSGPITMINDNEARLAFDYLFANSYEGGVALSVEIYNALGTLIASVKNIDIPLIQGHLTVLKGKFMTSSAGGVGISTEFIGPDYNIKI